MTLRNLLDVVLRRHGLIAVLRCLAAIIEEFDDTDLSDDSDYGPIVRDLRRISDAIDIYQTGDRADCVIR